MAMQTTQSLGQKFLQSIGLGGSMVVPAPEASVWVGFADRRRSNT